MEVRKYTWDEKHYTFNEIERLIKPVSYVRVNNKNRIGVAYNLIEWNKVQGMLDIGCETGRFLDYVHHFHKDIKFYGVDCNSNSIEIANDLFSDKNIDFKLIACDNKLPFDTDSFELITFFEVLEHVRNVEQFLQEVKRILKPNGCICLSVPNALWWRNNLKHMFVDKKKYAIRMESWPNFSPDQRDHVNSYDFIILYRTLNLNGFKLIDYGYADNKFTFLNKLKLIETLCSNMIMYLKLED